MSPEMKSLIIMEGIKCVIAGFATVSFWRFGTALSRLVVALERVEKKLPPLSLPADGPGL